MGKRSQKIELEDVPIVQEWIGWGLEEGEERGIRKSLVRMVQKRFPSLADLARAQVSSITSVTILEDLIDRIVVARTAKEAQSCLTEWREIYKDQQAIQALAELVPQQPQDPR